MISVMNDLTAQYEEALQYADPRTKDWFLLHSTPVYVWLLTIAYLLIVWQGPKYMNRRQPYDLKWFMFVYNIGLVGLSLYMFIEIILATIELKYDYICAPYNQDTIRNPKEIRMAKVLWWYFFSKAVELNDTVLMVLRKKNNQISFLHVFHHASMLNIWWWVMMFIPGGLSFFGAGLNCLVHVVMYSYYGLSVIPALKDKLWWKHYITRFQLIQFCLTLTHTMNSLYMDCDFPVWGKYLLASLMILMLILFTNFYIQSYVVRSRARASRAKRSNASVADNTVANGYINGYDVKSDKKAK